MVSCKLAVSCADDAHVWATRPTTYARRYGPASDAEFLRSIADKTVPACGGDDVDSKLASGVPAVVMDGYSCWQMYLKSYVFVRKETVREKTRRYVDVVREKAGDLPLLHRRRRRPRSSSSGGSFHGSSTASGATYGDEVVGTGRWCGQFFWLARLVYGS